MQVKYSFHLRKLSALRIEFAARRAGGIQLVNPAQSAGWMGEPIRSTQKTLKGPASEE
jgi:hypothetical protein